MKSLLTSALLVCALVLAGLQRPAWALYLLDYGDSVSVVVKDFPQYSYTGSVRPDGLISIPFAGDIEVGGLTTAQAAARVTTVLKTVVRDPIVTVTLTTLRPRYAMVLGQVVNPGRVELNRPHPTVLDVIGSAGGFTQRAVKNEVLVLRGEGTRAKHFVVNVEQMLKTADLAENVEIQPGDRVAVPEVWYPNLTETMQVISPFITVGTMIFGFISFYNQLSAMSQQQR